MRAPPARVGSSCAVAACVVSVSAGCIQRKLDCPPVTGPGEGASVVGTGANLLGAGLKSFEVQGDKDNVGLSTVPVSGQPFTEALRAEVKKGSPNEYAVQLRAPTAAAKRVGAETIATVPMLDYVVADTNKEVSESEKAPSKRWAKSLPHKSAAYAASPDLNDGVVYEDEFVDYLVKKRPAAAAPRAGGVHPLPELRREGGNLRGHGGHGEHARSREGLRLRRHGLEAAAPAHDHRDRQGPARPVHGKGLGRRLREVRGDAGLPAGQNGPARPARRREARDQRQSLRGRAAPAFGHALRLREAVNGR
ncbi:MAG: hypothetical protein JOZ69_08025 [Myxococcales bacterium]|nr:hypothetical protein [Myxococcales bacterium]